MRTRRTPAPAGGPGTTPPRIWGGYSPETLITALESGDGGEKAVSSSTKPDLMVRMLETLDVHDGHRILEIGTGTGYNAALLSHRLGDQRVYSVDVDAELVTLARARLSVAGYHPTVVAGDGAHGLPEHAPYDRIIATCSVPAIPWEWAEQLAPGGAILVDVKLGVSAGNLALLRRVDDRLEGHFTQRWAAFMRMRSATRLAPAPRADRAAEARTRFTDIPATPWSANSAAWFLAHLKLPAGLTFGFDLDPATRRPAASTLAAPDGSWVRRSLTDETVTEGGSTPLWRHVEWGYRNAG